jgi:hypothetical protein
MEFLGDLALVLLTLVGYSGGRVLPRRDHAVSPVLVDMPMILVLWVGGLVSEGLFARWASILLWIVIGLVIGSLFTLLTRKTLPPEKEAPDYSSLSFLKRIWEGWKFFAQGMGNFQARLILYFFYFVIVLPFGLLTRIFMDPLQKRQRKSGSLWIERHQITDNDIESARRQF